MKVKKPHIRQLGEGSVLIVIGIVIFLLIPSQIEQILWMETSLSPSFFPMTISIAIIAVGIGLIFQSFLNTTKAEFTGFSYTVLFRVGLAVVSLILYAFLFSNFGFVVTSAFFLGIYAYLFGGRSIIKIGLSMTLIPLCVWLFFEKIFHIPLPHGLLF